MDIIHCLPRWRIHLTVSRIEFQSFFLCLLTSGSLWTGIFVFMFFAFKVDHCVPEIW